LYVHGLIDSQSQTSGREITRGPDVWIHTLTQSTITLAQRFTHLNDIDTNHCLSSSTGGSSLESSDSSLSLHGDHLPGL